jgi:hypothetical protein
MLSSFFRFSISLLPPLPSSSIRYCLAGDDKREKRSPLLRSSPLSGMDEQGLLLEIAFLENDEKGFLLKGSWEKGERGEGETK